MIPIYLPVVSSKRVISGTNVYADVDDCDLLLLKDFGLVACFRD